MRGAGRLPRENLIYLGDTARLPYGTKGKETIIRYSQRATQKLVDSGIKMLVIACNTATSAALPTLREQFAPLPVMGVQCLCTLITVSLLFYPLTKAFDTVKRGIVR